MESTYSSLGSAAAVVFSYLMITSANLKPTMYSEEIITQQVNLEDLFKED